MNETLKVLETRREAAETLTRKEWYQKKVSRLS